MEKTATPGIREIAQIYAFGWLTLFVITLVTATVANGIWAVPLSEVANTSLALTISVVMVFIAICLILAAIGLITGEFALAIGMLVFASVYAFFPYASVIGYMTYGFLGGHPLHGASFVYNWYGHLIDVMAGDVGLTLRAIAAKFSPHTTFGYLPPPEQLPGWISAIAAMGSFLLYLFGGRRTPAM